ncbi:hypothetical protein DDE82_006737 [Stemphylium lycopersici]|nr:hypothetical protein DDE82_006737 [Stemphylium lycopersici]
MANTSPVTFTSREMEVLALAWQCMETQPKIDMTKLASLTGYTPGSASVTLGKIKQKIKLIGNNAATNAPATPRKTGGGRPKTASTPLSSSSSSKRGASAAMATPSKRPRKGVAREEQCGDGGGDDDDEEDFGVAGIKVKKEEEVQVKDEAAAYHGDAGNYGLLDGMDKFARRG